MHLVCWSVSNRLNLVRTSSHEPFDIFVVSLSSITLQINVDLFQITDEIEKKHQNFSIVIKLIFVHFGYSVYIFLVPTFIARTFCHSIGFKIHLGQINLVLHLVQTKVIFFNRSNT